MVIPGQDDRAHPLSPAGPHPLRSLTSSRAGSSSHIATESSLPARYPKRGLTFEEIDARNMIDDQPRSKLFDGLPIEDEEIKKLPRKLRGYYRNLALLHEHYVEVDGLLSGEIPSTVVSSFQSSHDRWKQRHEDSGETTPLLEGSDQPNGAGRRKSKSHLQSEGGEARVAEEGTGQLSLDERDQRRERIANVALIVNTVINLLLVVAKGIAVAHSSSVSLTASLVDSALDLLSTFIILGTSWAIGAKFNAHKYPAGKRRFEPLGVLIFAVAMIASFVQVFIESFKRAIGPKETAVDLSAIGIATMGATIGIKLVIWFWCARIPSTGVQALAQDAKNDVFFNIFSLAFPFIGQKANVPLLDPIGGMLLSTYIIIEWIRTLFQNFGNLSGKAAPKDQITRVLYLVSRFNPVLEIADVECYHIGDDLIVEIDVILPRASTLHFAHDVGETVQCLVESLDGVLRAYVHCDYSSANPAQHTSRAPPAKPAAIPSPLTNGHVPATTVDTRSSVGSTTPRPSYPVAAGAGGDGATEGQEMETVK